MTDTAEKCRSCGAPIIWAKTQAGKDTPLDAKPLRLAALGGDLFGRQITGVVEGYVSHFATCPNAKQHRKPR